MSKQEEIEIVRGSGNIFDDFGTPDADLRHSKARVAARIINNLDDAKLSVRAAQKRTGFDAGDFSRVRNADFSRISLDRLIRMLSALIDDDMEVYVDVDTRPRAVAADPPRPEQGA